MRRVIETVRALTKRFASHWKGAWELGDYPIRVVGRDVGPEAGPARLKAIPWSAQIINWWQMAGHGSTRDEALANLRQNFATYRSSHEVLPRPGTGAPLEFAATAPGDQHRELAHDFMSRILSLNLDDCFISDESSLWISTPKRRTSTTTRRSFCSMGSMCPTWRVRSCRGYSSVSFPIGGLANTALKVDGRFASAAQRHDVGHT